MLGLTGPFEYTVTVRDAAGHGPGRHLRDPDPGRRHRLRAVRGELAISDPDTVDSESLLGRMVTLQVAQLVSG